MKVSQWLGVLACLVLSGCATWGPDGELHSQAIQDVLDRQVAAWNRADIEAFMTGYVTTEALRFAGASGVQRGYQATLQRYRKAYPNKSAMGQLTFSNLEIKPLSRRYAEVFGSYHLKRGGSYKDATGLFTLLFERTAEGWRIRHDHSSAIVP